MTSRGKSKIKLELQSGSAASVGIIHPNSEQIKECIATHIYIGSWIG